MSICLQHHRDCIRTENCISIRQPTTGNPTKNRAQSNLFELPKCEGGNRKVTFRASINTAYRDRKIKENPNGFLDRINTISLEVLLLKHYSVIDAPSSWHACTKCRFTHRYIKFVHHFKYSLNIIFCFKNKQINAFADFC